ncbi:TPA: hypothetical protein HA251_05175 [Candidatus Woesearchaeota archaeon]|nr:hypothetical protein [Candidatus Woesearchaeota archaeon]
MVVMSGVGTAVASEYISLNARPRKRRVRPIMDGGGKRIFVFSNFMGATKQLPPLLREIDALLPNAEIGVMCQDHHGNGAGLDVLRDNLSRVDPLLATRILYIPHHLDFQLRYLNSEHQSGDCAPYTRFISSYDIAIGPAICFENHALKWTDSARYPRVFDEPKRLIPHFQFWIDPLKYEPRELLGPDGVASLREKYGLNDERVVVVGSLNSNEAESFMDESLRAVSSAIDCAQRTRFIIVPRDTRCTDKVVSLLDGVVAWGMDASPLPPSSWSRKQRAASVIDAVVVTENGVLQDLYSIADLAVVGGTFWKGAGGQNPLEPAFYGKPIVCGPHWENNAMAFSGLRDSGLLRVVEPTDLGAEIYGPRETDDLAASVARAQAFIASKKGAAKEYAATVRDALYNGMQQSSKTDG